MLRMWGMCSGSDYEKMMTSSRIPTAIKPRYSPWGGDRQVEELSGEAKVRVPCCQSMSGLCRVSQGNPSTSWKWASLVT